MTGKRWTADEDAYLRERWKTGRGPEIAAHLGRSAASVCARVDKLKLPRLEPRSKVFSAPTPGMLALAGRFYGPAYAAELHGVDVERIEAAMQQEAAALVK